MERRFVHCFSSYLYIYIYAVIQTYTYAVRKSQIYMNLSSKFVPEKNECESFG